VTPSPELLATDKGMEHSRKMALVPHDVLRQLQSKQQQLDNSDPNLNRMVDLDSELKSIINAPANSDAKFKQYQQTLQRYLLLKEEQRKPMQLEIVTTAQQETAKPGNMVASGKLDLNSLVSGLPKTHKNAAKLLIHHLQATNAIDWNDVGEVLVDGQRVLNSNISELFTAVSRRTKALPDLPGLDAFVTALKRSDVPTAAIVNKRLMGSPTPIAAAVQHTPEHMALPGSRRKIKKARRRLLNNADKSEDDDTSFLSADSIPANKTGRGRPTVKWLSYRL